MLACLALVGSLAARADAHAILVESTPASGAVVDGPEVAVRLVFNSRIDVARSTLRLTGEIGGLPRPLPMVPDPEPNTLSARAIDLTPGSYHIQWQVLSLDGHVSRGEVPFSVRAP
ncbi:MAG: copper resistance CopC family protein [bacterium]